eukprot:365566-Chlamydomonas_euryale.AAC.16
MLHTAAVVPYVALAAGVGGGGGTGGGAGGGAGHGMCYAFLQSYASFVNNLQVPKATRATPEGGGEEEMVESFRTLPPLGLRLWHRPHLFLGVGRHARDARELRLVGAQQRQAAEQLGGDRALDAAGVQHNRDTRLNRQQRGLKVDLSAVQVGAWCCGRVWRGVCGMGGERGMGGGVELVVGKMRSGFDTPARHARPKRVLQPLLQSLGMRSRLSAARVRLSVRRPECGQSAVECGQSAFECGQAT